MEIENYFFDVDEKKNSNKVFVLIIYDIVNNSKRAKFAKYLQGFGFRIQKSAFEAMISENLYVKLLNGIDKYISSEDSVKVYKIIGKGQVKTFGKKISKTNDDDVIII